MFTLLIVLLFGFMLLLKLLFAAGVDKGGLLVKNPTEC